MRHDGVASSYTTPTGFRRLTSCQQDPPILGVTLNRSFFTSSEHTIIGELKGCALSI